MAFTDAVFDGRAMLEGIWAVRVDTLVDLPILLEEHAVIPVVASDFARLLGFVSPDILVDARMRKRAHPEEQCGMAPLTIGLGPNFVAGETTDLAVETQWGKALGTVLTHGATRPLEGEPQPIGGIARARYVYAPADGLFRTTRRIGDLVCAGEAVAHLGSLPLPAPLDGALRGLTHDQVPVTTGTKIMEIDPRGPTAVVLGIGERPSRIADGVGRAVQIWADIRV
jgi:xanthine dehydrogenase accessory factor